MMCNGKREGGVWGEREGFSPMCSRDAPNDV